MTKRRIKISDSLFAVACSLLLAYPADARSADMRCSARTSLTEGQRLQTVDQLIEDAIRSPEYRKYVSFDRARIRRCLERHRPQLLDDFDEPCARRNRSDLQAMNRTFKTYTWSCAS